MDSNKPILVSALSALSIHARQGYSRQDDPKNRAAQNVIHDDGLQKGSSDDLPGHPPE